MFSKPTYVIYCTPKRYVLTTEQLSLICFGRVCVHTQVCWTFYSPMNCSLPQSSVHRIFYTRILEWVVISYSRGIFPTQDGTCVSCVSCIGKWIFFYQQHHLGSPFGRILQCSIYAMYLWVYIYIYFDHHLLLLP